MEYSHNEVMHLLDSVKRGAELNRREALQRWDDDRAVTANVISFTHRQHLHGQLDALCDVINRRGPEGVYPGLAAAESYYQGQEDPLSVLKTILKKLLVQTTWGHGQARKDDPRIQGDL